MKKRICLLFFLSIILQNLLCSIKFEEGMEYYFTKLIPEFYNGRINFYDKESLYLQKKFDLHMQGDGFSRIGKNNLIETDFYFLIDHKRQNAQLIKLCEKEINGKLYEYWCTFFADRSIPYDKAIFYITESNSLTNKRVIIDKRYTYVESYKISKNINLDFSNIDLIVLYQIKPWIVIESFKGTRYENTIVKWKKSNPYIRKQNLLERIYYKKLKKRKKNLEILIPHI